MHAMVTDIQHIRKADATSMEGRFEAMVASSKLLAWEAPSRREYATLLRGIIKIYNERNGTMREGVSFAHPNPCETKLKSAALPRLPDETTATDCQVMLEKADISVACLAKCSLDTDLKAAVQELACFIRNMRLCKASTCSMDQMMYNIWPVRNSFRHVPDGPGRLARSDASMIVYLANHDIALLIAGAIFPGAGFGLSSTERAKCTARMHEAFTSGLFEIGRQWDDSADDGQKGHQPRQLQAFQAFLDASETCLSVFRKPRSERSF